MAVCEKSRGLPGMVAETCLLVATALRHALHSPEAPCLRRLLSADLPWPRLTDCPRRGERSNPSMATRRHAVGLLVLCAVLWSTGGLLIKWLPESAFAIAGVRSVIAAVVLLLALREWPSRWSWWLGTGALAGAASMLGFVIATKLTTAPNAIFLVYTAPLYVALLSPWVLHEPIHRDDWLTLLLAVLGLGCFCFEQLTLEGWVGNGCALGSGLATAWLVVCLRKQAARSPLPLLVLANLLVAVAGVPFLAAARPDL